MKIKNSITSVLGALALGVLIAGPAAAVTVVNAGFNDQTGWTLVNDAELGNPGGTAPWTWTSPVAGNLITSTETINPTEGSGFGITYAGADRFLQDVNIAVAGEYIFSVNANALTGTAYLPNIRATRPLVNGAFRLLADGMSSSTMNVITTDGWTTYSWTATLAAGTIEVGLRNTAAAIYAIAYDDFRITQVAPVPLPAALPLFLVALGGLGMLRRRKST